MPPWKIAAIMVHTPDPEAALRWYERAIPGAVRVQVTPEFEVLQVGEIRLEAVPVDMKVVNGAAGTVIYWSVPNFQAALADLQSIGAQLYRGPMNIEDGQAMCQLQDPWGNCIGIRGKLYSPPVSD